MWTCSSDKKIILATSCEMKKLFIYFILFCFILFFECFNMLGLKHRGLIITDSILGEWERLKTRKVVISLLEHSQGRHHKDSKENPAQVCIITSGCMFTVWLSWRQRGVEMREAVWSGISTKHGKLIKCVYCNRAAFFFFNGYITKSERRDHFNIVSYLFLK